VAIPSRLLLLLLLQQEVDHQLGLVVIQAPQLHLIMIIRTRVMVPVLLLLIVPLLVQALPQAQLTLETFLVPGVDETGRLISAGVETHVKLLIFQALFLLHQLMQLAESFAILEYIVSFFLLKNYHY
jgi:hypothetical protein